MQAPGARPPARSKQRRPLRLSAPSAHWRVISGQQLQFKTPESYRSLNLDIKCILALNIGTFDPAPGVAEGMRANQKRFAECSGFRGTSISTPARLRGARELLSRPGLTGERVTGTTAPGAVHGVRDL